MDVPENGCFRRKEIKAGVEDQFWYKVDLFIGNLASGGGERHFLLFSSRMMR